MLKFIVILLFLVSLVYSGLSDAIMGSWLHPDQISTLVFYKGGKLDYERGRVVLKGTWKILDSILCVNHGQDGLMKITYQTMGGTSVSILFWFGVKTGVIDINGVRGDPLILPVQRIKLYRKIKKEEM